MHVISIPVFADVFCVMITVERVISMRDPPDGEDETEYLVKWKGLEYEECTWEKESGKRRCFRYSIRDCVFL